MGAEAVKMNLLNRGKGCSQCTMRSESLICPCQITSMQRCDVYNCWPLTFGLDQCMPKPHWFGWETPTAAAFLFYYIYSTCDVMAVGISAVFIMCPLKPDNKICSLSSSGFTTLAFFLLAGLQNWWRCYCCCCCCFCLHTVLHLHCVYCVSLTLKEETESFFSNEENWKILTIL